MYRWWSTKAEILFEASVIDAEQELAVPATGDLALDAATYLDALIRFLCTSPAGAAYRALLGEAQHDPAVADLVATKDVIGDSARRLLVDDGVRPDALDQAAAQLCGPPFFWIMTGRDPHHLDTTRLAQSFGRLAPAGADVERQRKVRAARRR